MADPMLPDEMLAGLRDIRLPEFAPGGVLAELAVAIGIGLLAACALSFVIARLTQPRVPAEPSLEDLLAQTRSLPEPERCVALLHLICARDAAAAHAFGGRLYGGDDFPTASELEQVLKAAPNV